MVTFPHMVEWSFHTTITNEEAITMDCHDYFTVAPERKRVCLAGRTGHSSCDEGSAEPKV